MYLFGDGDRRAWPVALFTAGAGAVHLAVAAPHFSGSVLLGSGFLAIGWSQIAAAVASLRRHPQRGAVFATVAVNIAALIAWVVSRTIGLPLLHAGSEGVGVVGLVTVGLEMLAVAAAAWQLNGRPARRLSADPPVLALVLAAALSIGGSSIAIAAIGTHGSHSLTSHGPTHEDGGRDHHADPHGPVTPHPPSATAVVSPGRCRSTTLDDPRRTATPAPSAGVSTDARNDDDAPRPSPDGVHPHGPRDGH